MTENRSNFFSTRSTLSRLPEVYDLSIPLAVELILQYHGLDIPMPVEESIFGLGQIKMYAISEAESPIMDATQSGSTVTCSFTSIHNVHISYMIGRDLLMRLQ